MKFLLSLLEPPLGSDPDLSRSDLRRFRERLTAWEGRDDDSDGQDGEQRHEREERHSREKQPRRFRFAAVIGTPAAAEAALARHGAEIILGSGPFPRRRLHDAVALHPSKVSAFCSVLNK